MNLIIEDGDGRRTVVPLTGDEITIGRNRENAVRLEEKNVSRKHGRLFREAGRFHIEDLRSLTGIRVNGEKVKGPRPVDQGDRIRIGDYELSLEAEPAEQPARRPADPAALEVPREKRARLLGISGTYRGSALVLDRSPLRIGSSGENDIVVHHPSISRTHLRLHLVGGEWKVLDAEARNGVRVNGESRPGIALRHGDVMEIGYLRFAFADAGRDLELPREFTPVSVKTQVRRGATMPVKTIVGLLAILLAGALLLRPSGSDGEGAEPERAAALRSARNAVEGHRYVEAQQKLEAARRAGATAVELADAEAVGAEARGESLFRDLQSAFAAKDWERARELASSLAGSHTWYAAQAAPLAQAATAAYVGRHVAAAAAQKGKDDAACLSEARLALGADASSVEAAQLEHECSAPAVQTGALAPAAPVLAAASPARAARSDGDASARRLVGEGNRKLTAQDFPAAIALYEQALVLKPARPVLASAYRGMGVAFTRQGNIEAGAHYYKLYLPLCADPAEKARVQELLDDYDARRR